MAAETRDDAERAARPRVASSRNGHDAKRRCTSSSLVLNFDLESPPALSSASRMARVMSSLVSLSLCHVRGGCSMTSRPPPFCVRACFQCIL